MNVLLAGSGILSIFNLKLKSKLKSHTLSVYSIISTDKVRIYMPDIRYRTICTDGFPE